MFGINNSSTKKCFWKIHWLWLIGNRSSCRPIWRVIILVIEISKESNMLTILYFWLRYLKLRYNLDGDYSYYCSKGLQLGFKGPSSAVSTNWPTTWRAETIPLSVSCNMFRFLGKVRCWWFLCKPGYAMICNTNRTCE